jgi:hypothetical protein
MLPKLNGEMGMNTYEIAANLGATIGAVLSGNTQPPPDDDPNLVVIRSPDPPPPPPSAVRPTDSSC